MALRGDRGIQFAGKLEPLSCQKYGNDLVDDCGCGDGASHNIAVLAERAGERGDSDAGQHQRDTGVGHERQPQIFPHGGRSA